MLRAIAPIAAAFLMIAVVACGGSDPVANGADNTAALPAPVEASASNPSGAPPPANSATPARPSTTSSPKATAAIPTALQGRWGMAPADCTSTRGDAKGLLIVGPGDLRFYESRAVPAGNTRSASDSFSADFAFSGEGMTWTKFETLRMHERRLVRTEVNPMASYTYARCD